MTLVVARFVRYGLHSDVDVVAARRAVNDAAKEIRLGILDRTKVVTAASELARNTVVHGGGGTMSLEIVRDGTREGLRVTFDDQGPGIEDIDRALQDGYSSGSGMGLGLPGARRLVNDFSLTSTFGTGTSVTIIRWRP